MKKILMLCVFYLLSGGVFAQKDVSWIRYAEISPSGKEIVFTYKGDLFKIGIGGGRATQLTTHAAYDHNPRWSPDGKWIAFNSNRYGSTDVLLMPSDGGTPLRLTTHSAAEKLQAFSPDGKEVYFTSNIQFPASYTQYPGGWNTQLYRVSVEGGRSYLVLPNALNNLCIDKSGKNFLYEDIKGSENEWRKHQTSSVARDIWTYNSESKAHTRLTTHANEDRNPVWSADEKTFYFLSERSGSFNIWKASSSQATDAVALTKYTRHPVRFLSSSSDETLCYIYDGELYVLPKGESPRKVSVDIFTDAANAERSLTLTSGATEAEFSPNGKEVALIIRGDVFVTSVEFQTTQRITNTPGTERSLSWSADGKTLAYAAERNGSWDICVAKNTAKNEPYFFSSNGIVEEVLVGGKNEDFQPIFAPSGKEIAFLRDRTKIQVIDVESKKIRQITDGSRNFSYSDGDQTFAWSPDSKWIVLSFMGVARHPYNDIGLVSAEGGDIVNLTYSGYMDESARFAMNGNVILFASDRFGMRSHASWGSQNDVMALFSNTAALDRFKMTKEERELDKERQKASEKGNDNDSKTDSKDKKKDSTAKSKALDIELAGIEDRILRLTLHSTNLAGFALTPDGDKLFYLANVEKGYDLWCRDFENGETKLLEKLGTGYAALDIDAKGEKLLVVSSNSIFTLDVKNTKNRKNVTYKATVDLQPTAEREAMFTHVWRTVSEKFYRTDLHGVDWNGLKKDYEKFLPHIGNYWDFSELLSEYLGELNASHTGSGYRGAYTQGQSTSTLGLFFDMSKAEKGLRIDEVLLKGPFDNAKTRVRAGHYLTHIEGVEIGENTDYFDLLNGKAGTEITLTFRDGANSYTERVKPVSHTNPQLYDRWIQAQRDRVEKLSGGKLGYAHIRSMNDESYRSAYSEILGRYNEKEGVVIDTRFNGGGRLHEDVEVLLSGTKYLEQVPRGLKINNQPTKRWLKPSIMIQGEANYSNAHGTPWVYKEMGIGKLVGMPVPGTMTSVWWENLPENGLYYGIPIGGYIDKNGNFLENAQLEPDIRIANETNILLQNRDQQIEEAVKILLQEIKTAQNPWKDFDYNKKK